MKKMNDPMSTPRSFDEAWKGIKTMNPGCSTEDAMKQAVRDYPGLHATMLEKAAPKSAAQIERDKVADRVLAHVEEAKKAGVSIGDHLKSKGIM